MKRIIPILLAALIVLFLFAGCEKKPGAEGVYTMVSMNGETLEQQLAPLLDEGMTMEEIFSLLGISSLDEYFTLTLNADGTLVVAVAGEDPTNGTWKQDDSKISATIDGAAVEMTLNGNELSFTADEQDYVLIKK